ncbi:MAG: sialidase family protein [Pirellulaceae bacterium]|nr:sialidase family protein [Pirellulaceae bacterium]HJN08924.1 sialidase family protein [Pirellulaceae bacterium]
MLHQHFELFVRVACALSLLVIGSVAAPLNVLTAAEGGYEGDVTSVVTIDSLDAAGPYNKIWEPYLAKWSGKHYVAAYGLQVRGKSDMGDIVCSISRDAGQTWSPRIMVFDHRVRNGTVQYAYNNSVLFRPPGQDVIWLFVMRAPMHYRDSENADHAPACYLLRR